MDEELELPWPLDELRFQHKALAQGEKDLEYCLGVAEVTSNDKERRQAWRRACRFHLEIGERGAMIAEHFAHWMAKKDLG